MARIKGPKKTNRYPDDFKIKAVQLADHPDILAKDVAEDLGIHPFEHLRRSPSAHMAKIKNVDPAMARRHHCPLGINDPNMGCNNCKYRRIVFVEIDNPSNNHISGKELFAFNTRRTPIGFIDIDTQTGEIINKNRVDSKTAWSDVPTPAI